MNSIIATILFSLIFIGATSGMERPVANASYIRGCYFTNWAQYRTGLWKYWPENYEAGLCSHIFYAFVSMGDDFLLKPFEKNDEDVNGKPGLFSRVISLKKKQSDLKVILSFGGYLFSQANGELMRKLLASKDNRQKFIKNAIVYVRKHKFDGLDISWFPTNETKNDFVLLVKEMREAIDKEPIGKLHRLILTAAVPPIVDRIAAGYDGEKLAASVDFLNVMAFDYHGSWENQTGFNTPMVDQDGDGLSINSTFSYLVNVQHIPKKKLLVGFAAYGRGWTISNDSVPNHIPSPALGPSPMQPYTRAAGVASYFEICSLIEHDGYKVEFNNVSMVPFAYKMGPRNGVWIGYDNVQSYNAALTWLIENGYGGAFVWTLDMDDFRGQCKSSKGAYPLIKAIRSKLAK